MCTVLQPTKTWYCLKPGTQFSRFFLNGKRQVKVFINVEQQIRAELCQNKTNKQNNKAKKKKRKGEKGE